MRIILLLQEGIPLCIENKKYQQICKHFGKNSFTLVIHFSIFLSKV